MAATTAFALGPDLEAASDSLLSLYCFAVYPQAPSQTSETGSIAQFSKRQRNIPTEAWPRYSIIVITASLLEHPHAGGGNRLAFYAGQHDAGKILAHGATSMRRSQKARLFAEYPRARGNQFMTVGSRDLFMTLLSIRCISAKQTQYSTSSNNALSCSSGS